LWKSESSGVRCFINQAIKQANTTFVPSKNITNPPILAPYVLVMFVPPALPEPFSLISSSYFLFDKIMAQLTDPYKYPRTTHPIKIPIIFNVIIKLIIPTIKKNNQLI
jgi:hypothetical protein